MSIADFLMKQRKDKKMTVRELSRLSGVSHPYISQIETGKNDNPSTNTLKKLAKGLGIAYTDLLWEAGKEDLYKAEKFKEATRDFADDGDFIDLLDRLEALEKLKDLKDALENYIEQGESAIPIFYNKHSISIDNGKRLLNVMKELFPEYREEGSDLKND